MNIWARYFSILALGLLSTAMVGWDLARRGLHRYPAPRAFDVPAGDAARGRAVILEFGCGACHVVPGIREATGRVGPQLIDFRSQIYIAGFLPNTPENLVEWIYDPQRLDPRTAMPTLGMSEPQARDAAAYLYSVQ